MSSTTNHGKRVWSELRTPTKFCSSSRTEYGNPVRASNTGATLKRYGSAKLPHARNRFGVSSGRFEYWFGRMIGYAKSPNAVLKSLRSPWECERVYDTFRLRSVGPTRAVNSSARYRDSPVELRRIAPAPDKYARGWTM